MRAPGYASLRVALDASQAELLGLRLPRLAFIEGRVTTSTGEALQGVSVTLQSTGPIRDPPIEETSPLYELPGGWSYRIEDAVLPSDADGHYQIPVLPWSLNCTVSVRRRGFGDDGTFIKSIGEPGSRRRLDWRLAGIEERTVVTGRVRLNGAPCGSSGMLTWSGPTRSGQRHFKKGVYSADVEPGEVRLTAVLGFAPGLQSGEVLARLQPGDIRYIDLDVTAPTATITGSVRFADGTPLPGREVSATESSDSLVHGTRTDEKGAFELRVADVGVSFDVLTEDVNGRPLYFEKVAPGASGIDFVLGRGYRFFLRARESSTGSPLMLDREVQFFVRGNPAYSFWPLKPDRPVPDADGWYEFWSGEREADLLAVPRVGELPLYGLAWLRRARLDGRTPPRLELLLERGIDVSLQLAEGVEPWPAGAGLLLVEEDLWKDVDPAPWHREFQELVAPRSVNFDEVGHALVRGLSPGSYRFKPLRGDLLVEPELVRVDRGMQAVQVRWSRRE